MMLNGWMICNGSLKTASFLEMMALYKKAAKNIDMQLEIVYNDEILMGLSQGEILIKGYDDKEKPDFILFLDKDIRLARMFERKGIRVFNSSKVIEVCDDKSQTFERLEGAGISMPCTIVAPLVYKGRGDISLSYIKRIEEELEYPIVVKESYGSFGEQVYLARNRKELIELRERLLDVPHIYQEFIQSSSGKDMRIYVVGGKVIAAMQRSSESDFRANVAQGAVTYSLTPPKSFVEMALKACEKLEADFAGVDLLYGPHDEPILCEVNSNAHIKGILECTGINVAEHILGYISKTLKK